jgi:dihydrofolate synthase / folylpolyglutamate synthase
VRWLGPTLEHIAAEKLAVVRDHATLVAGELPPEARAVAERVAAERHARLVWAAEAVPEQRVRGAFQRRNFAVARAAAEAFLGRLDDEAVGRAAAEVVVPGRLQQVGDSPLVLYDGAHNPAGAEALAEALPELVGGRRLIAVIGVLDDKDAGAMLQTLLPVCAGAVFTRSANPRSLSPATLQTLAEHVGGPSSECLADPRAAVERARELAGLDGAVVVTGSIYLIADLVRDRATARTSRL